MTIARRHRPLSSEELGPLVAYTGLAEGTPVYDRDWNEIGVVEHVFDEGGIFEGILVHTHPLPGRHLYADVDQIAELHERGVLVSVPAGELHDPAKETSSRRSGAGESALEARLRRAWDWLTGRT